MHGLDIVRVIVSPGSSHAARVDVIGHDVVVVGKRPLADGAPLVLRDDLAIEQLPHLPIGTELAEASGMMRIFDALHTQLFEAASLENDFPATTREGAVNRTVLVTAKFH
jgi:hypothetical protein